MTMIGTCGHEIKDTPNSPIAVKTTYQDDIHAISWSVLCSKCVNYYRKIGMLLETEKERDEWLHSIPANRH